MRGAAERRATSRYTGQWCGGKKHGEGEYSFGDSGRYKGQFRDGQRHGHGEMRYANVSTYIGQWKDDKPDGEGESFFADGTAWYRGQYVRGKPHGSGEKHYPNGGCWYQGQWKDGERHGNGRHRFNGEWFLGKWKDGVMIESEPEQPKDKPAGRRPWHEEEPAVEETLLPEDEHRLLLGVDANASQRDIKQAYHRAALKWHPDRWRSKQADAQRHAEETFKELANAYQSLRAPW